MPAVPAPGGPGPTKPRALHAPAATAATPVGAEATYGSEEDEYDKDDQQGSHAPSPTPARCFQPHGVAVAPRTVNSPLHPWDDPAEATGRPTLMT